VVLVVKARAARAAAASRASHVIKAASTAATKTVTSISAGCSRCQQQRLTPRFGGHYGLWRPLRRLLPTATHHSTTNDDAAANYLDYEESELESTEAATASGQRPQAPKLQQQEVCLTTTTAASGVVGLRGCSSLCRSLRPLPTL